MTLNFPDTPGNGEKYLAENGIEYTYNLANDTWTGALSAQNVPINPSPSDVSVDPPFGNPSGTNPGSGTLSDPFIITDSIVPTLNGSTESLQTITITSGKAGDQVVFTNNTTPLDISSKYTQPLGYIDANGKWIGKLVYNDSFGADTTSNTTYTGKLQCGTGTVYFQWNVQQQATPAMFVTAGTALTGTPVSGTDLGATQPTVTGGLSPYTYSYKWQTSDNNIAFTDIPSAITSSYSLTSANVGKYIRCIATVSDSSTIQAVTVSSITATVNVVSIDVSLSTNQPQANQPITATAVVLGGVSPITTAYQWKADGVNILGATSATYLVEVATDGKRLSCQITTTDGDNTNAVKTSTQTNPVASGDVPEINTVTLAEVTPDSPDRFTDQSFTVAVDMTKDNPKSDYAIRGKVLGDLTVDVETSVITKLEEEAVSGDWTAGTLAEDNGMVSVAYGAGKFVAVSENGTNRLQYSADGINWTGVNVESLAVTAQWTAVAYGNGAFVAVNGNGTNRAITSTDGINWTVIAGISNAPYYTDITYGDNRWVVISNSTSDKIVYSATGDPNGSWSNSDVPSGGTGNNWTSVAYGGGKYVAVSSGSGTGTNRVMYSSDGQNWTSTTSAVQNQWKSITYGDGKFVAVGAAGSPDQVMYSTDGINWTSTASSSPSNWTAVTYGKGKFLAVAGSDTIRVMYSTDGISWTSMTSGTPDGAWKSVVYGGDKFVSVAPGAVMWSYTGTGAAGTEEVLTLTDTSGLASINQGDVVVQNSGGTPVTTAITNVTNTPINKTQAYVFTGTPSNLADVLANGTLVTTGNTWNSSQNLVLVNNANNTIPDMTSVFTANGDTSFYLGLGASYGVTGNDADGGSFKADGTRLGGSGGYGNSEWTLMKYTDIANDGNYNSSYRIYDDAEVAYTVIGFYTANSNTTFGTIADVGTVDRPTLTLTDDTNLANFRVGDAVQGNPDWNQSQEWSTTGTVTGTALSTDSDITHAFDGNITGGNGALLAAANNFVQYVFNPPIAISTASYFISMDGGSIVFNVGESDEVTDTTLSGVIVERPLSLASGVLKSFRATTNGSTQGAYLWGVKTNSKLLVDKSVPDTSAIKVNAINEATPSITTDGGTWSGTDGTGEGWNQSQIWSSGASPAPVDLFNGNLSNGNAGNLVWTNPTTLTIASSLEFYSYKLSSDTSPNNKMSVVLSGVTEGIADLIPTGSAPTWWSVPNAAGKTLDQILIDPTENPWSPYIRAVRVDGKILVDTGIAGAPETFVTGPTQLPASGTVKLAGAREVEAAIQTSTITNVNTTATTTGPFVGARTYDGYGGATYNNATPYVISSGDTFNGTSSNVFLFDRGQLGSTYSLTFTKTGGSENFQTYDSDSPSTTFSEVVNNDPGPVIIDQNNTAFKQYVLIYATGSGSITWQLTGTASVGTVLTLTDDTDLALFTPGDVVQGGGTLNTTVTATAWQGSQSATTVAQVISVGGSMDTNYSGSYVWSTLVFSPPLQGNEFKFYVEAGCTVRNDSNNQTATASSTGDLVVPDDGTGLLSSVSFSVNAGQGGVTGPYVDGVLATNVVEVDTLTATASYGIPVSAKVVSTNLATPSITTDGGSWTGSDGTSSGDVSDRETKVTGPVKTTEQAGPYLTLSSSSGRWLVTETGYSALLKLNKFAKSSSVQSVASLFTVMDGLGNVTDLTTEDPGYTNMVGDPTYTLTFPSVFPSGETPDVELPPGTKYQVEVKATNDIGVDNAFSNDVMPVAGLLQSSVITANDTSTGVYSSTSTLNVTSGSSIVNAFDGDLTTSVNAGVTTSYTWLTQASLTINTQMRIYTGNGGVTLDYRINGAEYQNVAVANQAGWTIVPFTGVANGIEIKTQGSSMLVNAVEVDGTILSDSTTVLTTVDTTNYNLFSAGDDVVESSGGTPVTSAITNVANANYASTVVAEVGFNNNRGPDKGFDGNTQATGSATYCQSNTSNRYVQWNASTYGINTSTSLVRVWAISSGDDISCTGSTGTITIDATDNVNGNVVPDVGNLTSIRVNNPGGLGGFSGISVDGVLLIDGTTTLTFTNDTNIANFRVGDQLNGGSGFNPVIYTGNSGTQSITTGFAPDLVWIKQRTGSEWHYLFDTIRGVTNALYSNDTRGEGTAAVSLTAFDTDGFTLGSDSAVNGSGNYVAWCWDAGGTTVTNNDGTIPSQVRSNGNFSIVKYTGVGNAQSYGHGLNSAPGMIITKDLDVGYNWVVYNQGMGLEFAVLNQADAAVTNSAIWSSAPSDTVVNVGNGANVSDNGTNYISYCWAESPTQSFGSYTGNSSSQTINCGFEPAFVLIKSTSNSEQWEIVDNARNTSNPRNSVLYPNLSAAEVTGSTFDIDFTSTGFTLNNADGGMNYSGYTYIYAAFASGTTVTDINEAANQMTFDGGSFTTGESVTGPTFPPATGTILSTGTRITDKAIQTSTITNVGTAPWPLWNNTALNWSVTGTKTSYNNGGDVVTSALPTGSLLYTEFTIVGTSVQKQLGVQFTTTPNSAYDNNIVGWYFNGAGGSKAVWIAGGDSNSSMGAGMGGIGQALYTKADYDAGVSSGSSYGAGDVLGYAIDPDGNVWVSKNGVYLATAGWYAAGNESPVPGGSGYVSTINSDTRYFGAQYNGGQTFTISATGTYTPLQTSLTLTDDTDLAFFSYGDVVQVDGPPNTSLVYAQANDEDMGSYFNYFYASPEFQTAGWKITDFLDETLIGTSFTFSYFWSNDGVNWTKGGNYDSTSSPGAFPVDDSGYGAFTIYGQSGVGNAKISLRGVRYGGTVGTLPTANPFATDVSVTSTNLSTPSINTSGGDWIGTDGTGNTAWNQSQVWSQNNTGFAAAGLAMDAFDGSTVDTGYNRAYAAAMGTYATVTFASAITVSTSLRVWVGSGATQPNLLKINGNAISGSFPSVAGGWFTVPGISSLSSISVGRNSDGTYGDYTSLYAVEVDGQMLVDSGVSGAPETKVTGPVKTITQSGPYITFSETTGRWLVTQSDYDAAKKLDTTVRVPLVLDASNTAHVALFNAMNTKFTAFPTARQTFIDALRTKIIGLTLTTPELEVLCGTAKTLVKRHEITIVGNKFYIDGVLQATLSLKKGTTYIFDQDEATNSGHTLKLYTDANKTTEYTSGVTVIGTPGGATSRTTFVVPSNAPAVLYYQSTAAASMGGQLNIS